MVRLGRGYGHGPIPLAELAELEGLPPSYLEQIAGQLRRAGLVTSRMGVKGGYALARRPATISMADIVRNLEGSLAPVSPSDLTTCTASRSPPEDRAAILAARRIRVSPSGPPVSATTTRSRASQVPVMWCSAR